MLPGPALLAAALALTPAPPAPASVADTLPVPHAYLDALAAGTRSRTGAPGPGYWQQRVAYRIRTRLHPDDARVTGSETIRYENRSPDTLTAVWLNLPQNVFAPGNPRNRTVPVTGGFTLERVLVQGGPVTVERPGRPVPTSVGIPLPSPVPPGGVVALEIDFSFQVPEGTFRMGREGTEVFYLAQWYPQVAVYDDLQGWVRDPYLGDGEFYLDYGDFEVEITAPEGWLVSASGVLQNPDEVLRPEAVARLRGAGRDGVTPVVGRGDRDAGRSTAEAGPDGLLTWRYRAENVRDFAWGASDRYVWDATVAEYPGADGVTRSAAIHALYRPEQPNWERAAEYARHAIESHSYWYPYPYPQMTVNEGVIGGGMEYPMITIVGGGRTPLSLYGVVSHELAHMWWPMVVGSNERRHAWMDEGLASFSEDLFTPTLFPEAPGGVGTLEGYLRTAGTDAETESMRPADLYGPFGNRGLASYGKPATVFRALRAILGEETFDEAMRTYVRRWAFKHPHPLDLFWTFEDVAGRDLDWFFHPWLYTTRVLDQAIEGMSVEAGGRHVTVFVADRGEIPMPVHLTVEVEGGDVVRYTAGVERWREGRMELEFTLPAPVARAELDAGRMFPDVNRADNVWPR
ncbi:MAG: M1 family metallopeptidase [Longimicrobiales bacterium]|nr:M1 family metallopeptidase [Longimicrobiales bacterium]